MSKNNLESKKVIVAGIKESLRVLLRHMNRETTHRSAD